MYMNHDCSKHACPSVSIQHNIFLGCFNRWSRQDLGGMNFPLIISVEQTRCLKCGRSHIRKILDKTKKIWVSRVLNKSVLNREQSEILNTSLKNTVYFSATLFGMKFFYTIQKKWTLKYIFSGLFKALASLVLQTEAINVSYKYI